MDTKRTETRAEMRAAIFNVAPSFASELVQVEGIEYLVRQPSVDERSIIYLRAGVTGGDVKQMNLAALQVWSVVSCTRVPVSEELVFEVADVPSLLARPAGGLVDKLAEVAMRLMNSTPVAAGKT